MNRINWLFTFASLSVVLVTVERFSFTTSVHLPPHDFLDLHELLQLSVILLITVIIPFFLLREVSQNFALLRSAKGLWLFLIFLVGMYFYATGNGVHEVAGFTFGRYCDQHNVVGNLCGGLFINDYYTGNTMFFVGALLMNVSLLLLQLMNPSEAFGRRSLVVLAVNAVIYAVTVLAYAGFDVVLVGLVYTIVMFLFAAAVFLRIRPRYREFPLITYTALVYTLGAVSSGLVRLLG